MIVIVDESRNDGSAPEVRHLGVPAGEGLNFGVAADRKDSLPLQGDRFADGEEIVDGNDVAVQENPIRSFLGCRECQAGDVDN